MAVTARLDLILFAACVFAAMLILVSAPMPVHEAKVDTNPVLPVKTQLDGPIYVINLERNTDRLRMFAGFFADSDFKNQAFKRFPAVDGKKVELNEYVAQSAMPALLRTINTDTRTSHEQLTVGAVGCYLSHMGCWKAISESEKPYGLVFEDDAEIGRHALKNALSAMKSLPSDWDILLLGTACLSPCPVLPKTRVKRVTHFVRFHAYLISKKACKFLVSNEAGMLPMSMQVDWKLSELAAKEKLNIYTTKKFLVDSGFQGTEIQRPVFERK